MLYLPHSSNRLKMLSLRSYSGERPPFPAAVMICAAGLFAVLVHLAFVNVLLPARWRVNQSPDYFDVYQPTAQRFLAGKGFTANNGTLMVQYPPGFTLVITGSFAAAHAFGLSDDAGVRIETAATVALTGMLVYVLGAQISGWMAGLAASLLWSIYPLQLWLSKQPDSGQPFLVVFLLALSLLIWALQAKRASALVSFGAGVLIGWGSLIRPIGILLTPVVILVLWFFSPGLTRKARLGLSAVMLLGNLLAILPWELSAREATGRWIPLSSNGPASMLDGFTLSAVRKPLESPVPSGVRDLIGDFAREGRGLRSTGELMGLVAREAVDHPLAALELFTIKAVRCWYANDSQQFEGGIALVQAPFLLFGFWGMLAILPGKGRDQRWFAWLTLSCVLYFWAMSFLVLSIVRYMLPVMALLVICGAAGWASRANAPKGTDTSPRFL